MIRLFIEFIGTFLYLTFILIITKPGSFLHNIAPLFISIALIIYFWYMNNNIIISHHNPVVSYMMYYHNELSGYECIYYIISQIIAGYLALTFFKYSQKKDII